MLTIFFVIAGIGLFSKAVSELLSIISAEQHGDGEFRNALGKKLVLVTGNIPESVLRVFLAEFWHPDHANNTENFHVVILAEEKWFSVATLKFLQQHLLYRSVVTYLKGTVFKLEDIRRAGASSNNIQGAFFLTHKFNRDDKANVLRTIAFRRFVPGVPVYVVLNQQRSRQHVLSAGVPFGNIVPLDTLKLGLLAQNVTTPGASTLILNLFSSSAATEGTAYRTDVSSLSNADKVAIIQTGRGTRPITGSALNKMMFEARDLVQRGTAGKSTGAARDQLMNSASRRNVMQYTRPRSQLSVAKSSASAGTQQGDAEGPSSMEAALRRDEGHFYEVSNEREGGQARTKAVGGGYKVNDTVDAAHMLPRVQPPYPASILPPSWRSEYVGGMVQEVYALPVPPSLVGFTLKDAALLLYRGPLARTPLDEAEQAEASAAIKRSTTLSGYFQPVMQHSTGGGGAKAEGGGDAQAGDIADVDGNGVPLMPHIVLDKQGQFVPLTRTLPDDHLPSLNVIAALMPAPPFSLLAAQQVASCMGVTGSVASGASGDTDSTASPGLGAEVPAWRLLYPYLSRAPFGWDEAEQRVRSLTDRPVYQIQCDLMSQQPLGPSDRLFVVCSDAAIPKPWLSGGCMWGADLWANVYQREQWGDFEFDPDTGLWESVDGLAQLRAREEMQDAAWGGAPLGSVVGGGVAGDATIHPNIDQAPASVTTAATAPLPVAPSDQASADGSASRSRAESATRSNARRMATASASAKRQANGGSGAQSVTSLATSAVGLASGLVATVRHALGVGPPPEAPPHSATHEDCNHIHSAAEDMRLRVLGDNDLSYGYVKTRRRDRQLEAQVQLLANVNRLQHDGTARQLQEDEEAEDESLGHLHSDDEDASPAAGGRRRGGSPQQHHAPPGSASAERPKEGGPAPRMDLSLQKDLVQRITAATMQQEDDDLIDTSSHVPSGPAAARGEGGGAPTMPQAQQPSMPAPPASTNEAASVASNGSHSSTAVAPLPAAGTAMHLPSHIADELFEAPMPAEGDGGSVTGSVHSDPAPSLGAGGSAAGPSPRARPWSSSYPASLQVLQEAEQESESEHDDTPTLIGTQSMVYLGEDGGADDAAIDAAASGAVSAAGAVDGGGAAVGVVPAAQGAMKRHQTGGSTGSLSDVLTAEGGTSRSSTPSPVPSVHSTSGAPGVPAGGRPASPEPNDGQQPHIKRSLSDSVAAQHNQQPVHMLHVETSGGGSAHPDQPRMAEGLAGAENSALRRGARGLRAAKRVGFADSAHSMKERIRENNAAAALQLSQQQRQSPGAHRLYSAAMAVLASASTDERFQRVRLLSRSDTAPPMNISGHVIVSANEWVDDDDDHFQLFWRSLRGHSDRPIVYMTPNLPRKWVSSIPADDNLFFIKGDPIKLKDWYRAHVRTARRVVMLADKPSEEKGDTVATSPHDYYTLDSTSIFATLLMENRLAQRVNPVLGIGTCTELMVDDNIVFLRSAQQFKEADQFVLRQRGFLQGLAPLTLADHRPMAQNVPTSTPDSSPAVRSASSNGGIVPSANPLSPTSDSAHLHTHTRDTDASGGNIELTGVEPSAQDVVEHATDVTSPTEIDLDESASPRGSPLATPPPLVATRGRTAGGAGHQPKAAAQGASLIIPGLHIRSSGQEPATPPAPPRAQAGPLAQTAADMVGAQQGQGGDQATRVLDATRNMVADRLLPIYGDKRVGAGQPGTSDANAILGASEAALDDGLPHEAIPDARASGHDNFLLSEFVGTGSTDEATAMSAFKISSRFAAGRLFAAGALENVVISIFFSHAVVWLLHELSGGNRLRVQFHHIPPQLYGAPYGALYEHVVESEELVPMGLYRDGSHTNNALPYVHTNPGLDEFVREGDLLFVLAPKARFPRGQAADAIRLGTAAVAAAEAAAGTATPPLQQRRKAASPRSDRPGRRGVTMSTAQASAAAAAAAAPTKTEESDDSFSD